MSINTLIIKQKSCVTLDANSSANVVPIFEYVPYAKAGYELIDEYLEIENLKAVSWIYSLSPVPFPVFELEDTESKQLLTAINLEWQSPRIQLDVVCQIDNTLNWQRIAAYSLLNSDPYPYREYLLGNHTLGNNSMIGLQIKNVGFGLLQNSVKGQDKVVVYANVRRHIIINEPIPQPVIINLLGGSTPVPTPTPTPVPTPIGDDEMPLQIKSANYTLANKDRIFAKIDNATANFTLTLPPNPIEGDEIEIICSVNYNSTQVFIDAGNNPIFGSVRAATVVSVNNEWRGGKLLYTDEEKWMIYPSSGARYSVVGPSID